MNHAVEHLTKQRSAAYDRLNRLDLESFELTDRLEKVGSDKALVRLAIEDLSAAISTLEATQ